MVFPLILSDIYVYYLFVLPCHLSVVLYNYCKYILCFQHVTLTHYIKLVSYVINLITYKIGYEEVYVQRIISIKLKIRRDLIQTLFIYF